LFAKACKSAFAQEAQKQRNGCHEQQQHEKRLHVMGKRLVAYEG